MTGLDSFNMSKIENLLKKQISSLDGSGEITKVFEDKIQPATFAKVCVSLMWFIKV